ncbi:phage virion morphogenesis protein [Roseibium sp. TrichSKD4]|uniref:phage virion morphogenesis protein n=1 Tax=Roseibium sp. TrichSKD4 TaxID=744980 RepID=UPI0001E57077|nr:phage virion morphogenesis protein [Roseibium sp. TrichSKD4]EFO31676.1 phage virion morphogenesis protein [Roseibium sp. TrichSKD4]
MSVVLSIDTSDLDEALVRLKPLIDPDLGQLVELLADTGEEQTRRRIETEKTAPDGTEWPENAEGTSILRKTGGNLLNSVASSSSGTTAEWGATWEYAHVHQFGAVIKPQTAKILAFKIGGKSVRAKKVVIPARPFVGLSRDNEREMVDVVTDFFGIGAAQ